jgi:hypothetical protein
MSPDRRLKLHGRKDVETGTGQTAGAGSPGSSLAGTHDASRTGDLLSSGRCPAGLIWLIASRLIASRAQAPRG